MKATEDNREECGKELLELWRKYGIWTLIMALADEVEKDTRLVEQLDRFPEEVAVKNEMVAHLRKATASPIWQE